MSYSAQELSDRESIRDIIYTYCRYVDAEQWDRVRACFTPDAVFDFHPFNGSLDEFLGFADATIAQMDGTLHSIGNVLIDLSGDSATSYASFVAYHRIIAGSEGPIPSEAHDVDWTVAGRYEDKWRKIDSAWKIIHRTGHQDWVRREAATPKS